MRAPYYDKDGVTLYLGDWREVWAELGLKASDVKLVWADPTYGVKEKVTRASRGGRLNAPKSSRPTVGRDWPAMPGDDKPFEPAPLLALGAPLVCWGANHYASRLPDASCWWAWDKRESGTSDDNADTELAWTSLRGPARLFHHLWRGFMRRGRANGTEKLHPTEKPPELSTWGFSLAKVAPGDLVFSPFAGSCPEAMSARELGARIIACDVVEPFLAAAVRRLTPGGWERVTKPLRLGRASRATGQDSLFSEVENTPPPRVVDVCDALE